jgi:hypothetical protein
MTLNISHSMGAAPCRRDSRHGCRHPPPPAHPNRFVWWDIEQVSEGLIPALWSGLLKIGSVWLVLTPALLAIGHAAGPDALLPFQSALLVR